MDPLLPPQNGACTARALRPRSASDPCLACPCLPPRPGDACWPPVAGGRAQRQPRASRSCTEERISLDDCSSSRYAHIQHLRAAWTRILRRIALWQETRRVMKICSSSKTCVVYRNTPSFARLTATSGPSTRHPAAQRQLPPGSLSATGELLVTVSCRGCQKGSSSSCRCRRRRWL